MLNRTFPALVLALAMGFAPYSAAEQLTDEKTSDIRLLMETTNALAMSRQLSQLFTAQLWQSVKAARPDLPQRFFDVLQDEVGTVIDEKLPELAELMIPVYHKNFTHAEIKGLIRFYRTDLGVKIIEVMPRLMGESMSLGQQWGTRLAPKIQRRVLERLKAEGVDLTA